MLIKDEVNYIISLVNKKINNAQSLNVLLNSEILKKY